MKKVIYHFRTRGTGPEGVHIAGIAEGFEEAGYEVSFVSPTGRDPRQFRGSNPFKQSRESLVQRLSRYAPQVVFECGEIAYNRSAIQQMQAAMQDCDWIYERYAFFCHAAQSVAERFNKPYALEVNELAGDERVRKQVLTKRCRENERRILLGAKAVFPVSQYLADRIAEIGVMPERIHVVPNGVDAQQFFGRELEPREHLRARYGLQAGDRAYGFVGWFVPWHELDRLLSAFAQSFAGQLDRKLVLAGDGPLREALLEQAQALGIQQQLLLPGAIDYADIPAFLSALDVGIVPAVNAFRSPIKLFEYMGAGLPIVASRVEAVQSVLPDMQSAFLFDQTEIADLVRALQAVDACDAEVVGRENRALCQQQYTYQKHAQTICQVMEAR
ncbi:glycosyltransferase family 4 protein [Coraliomargarita sp. SDUM461003]|uniref:Glycosyltransferase family 4 protein n=1 Tax=Thalassobacterium maritimum TaxID=3041265 RepID=A0ABU1AWK1_9BACT|nr:glycosyltransferase family 4 protein [Coraliomargarita sp. SDUM461003]MDQ8208531.1 glycosyltransferase family 4 protein [Coraliomargarita sp. SDUM461003]